MIRRGEAGRTLLDALRVALALSCDESYWHALVPPGHARLSQGAGDVGGPAPVGDRVPGGDEVEGLQTLVQDRDEDASVGGFAEGRVLVGDGVARAGAQHHPAIGQYIQGGELLSYPGFAANVSSVGVDEEPSHL